MLESISESLELASAHFKESMERWDVALEIYKTINFPNGNN